MGFASRTRHIHDVLPVRMSRSQWWGKQSSRCDIVSYCLRRLWMTLDRSLILSCPLRLCSFRPSTYEAVPAGRMYDRPAVLDSGWSRPGRPASRKDDQKKTKAKQTTHVLTAPTRCKEPRQEYGVLSRSDRTHAWNRTEPNKAKEGREP